MSHPRLSILGLILTVVLCSGLASAQINSTTENEQATKALREKAFKLLESVAGELGTLQSAENRARLGSNIVDSLWDHDEKRARDLLVLVEENIKSGLADWESRDPQDQHTTLVFLKLRADTIERVAKHDGELAFAFFKATEITSEKPLPHLMAENEHALEMRLSRQIALTSPELAVNLARKSLANGFSDELLSLLRRLSRKHKDKGLILYKEIVAKVKEGNLEESWDYRHFVQSLINSYLPPAADESIFRELINLVITSALANGCGNKMSEEDERIQFCQWVGSTVHVMEKFEPLRVARLKRWMPEDREWSRPMPQVYIELNDAAEDGTVDDILALAPKFPEMQAEIYWRAIMKARADGDIERARKIATNYNGIEKQRFIAALDVDPPTSFDEEKLADIQNSLAKTPNVKEKINLLVSVANRIGTGDRKTTLKLLDQANELVDTMKPGKEQTQYQIGMAMMYCLEKSDRGLASMESLVPRLNELIDAAVKLDKYDTNYLRDGEWNMSANGNVGELLTLLAQNAGFFAAYDFDRAVSLAGQFIRPEIRLMAQLKLAQGILAGPPKRNFGNYAQRY